MENGLRRMTSSMMEVGVATKMMHCNPYTKGSNATSLEIYLAVQAGAMGIITHTGMHGCPNTHYHTNAS